MRYFCHFWMPALFVLSYYGSLGQEKFISISGKVLEAGTQKPVPFANIQLQSGSSGTASNVEGSFIFKVPEKLWKDTLVVSCVGYKTCKKPIRQEAAFETIILEPAATELKEVTVDGENGLAFLKRVLAKIPENYDTADHRLTAFYRENIGLGDFELSFNEAVLDIRKTFKTGKTLNDQIRIIKGRKKKIDYSSDPQLYHWISGISNGARGSLGDDLVKYRNARLNPLNPKNYRYYNYEYGEVIHEGDRDLVALNILPKKNYRKALLRVKLFIDEASLAIARYDFELTEAGVAYVSRKDNGLAYLIMSVATGATRDYHKFHTSVTYKQYEKKWYLGTVIRHWEILMNSKKRNMVDRLWHANMDFMVTDINTHDVAPITEGDIGKNEASIKHLIGNNIDEAFWEHHNTLKSVVPDSLKARPVTWDSLKKEKTPDRSSLQPATKVPNRQNGFTRADTLRGKLSPLRSCYDVTFYHLDVAVNMDRHSVKGSNAIRFNVMEPFTVMQVDLYGNMKIEKILFKGRPLTYTREHDAIFVRFPEVLKKGSQAEVIVYYEGIPKVPDWSVPMNGGVLWDKDEHGNAWAQVVCQGSGASLWWPNKDHLSDEPDSMKIWITVPAKFTEISNGRLIRKTQLPDEQTRYEWFVSYPINNYNVTFNIGMYAHYRDLYITNDTLTIDYYVMPYNLERARSMFGQVKPMLDCFEKHFGKYPFPRDGFTLVESLYPMEHQSGVCIGRITQQNSVDTNPLLWHESAHEWWGNAISCKDMADLWFHEAFATYAEALMIECQMGKDAAIKFISDLQGKVKNREPVIGVYDVNHIFYDIGDMYDKGCLMLNTFRHVLNDDGLWFTLLRDIQLRFRYTTLTSDELIAYINHRTGSDYTYFFDQYLKQITLPVLEIALKEQGNDLIVKYRWQAVAEGFRMPVQITTAADRYDVIYPVQEWKTATLKNLTADQFEVAEDKFYIEVEEVE